MRGWWFLAAVAAVGCDTSSGSSDGAGGELAPFDPIAAIRACVEVEGEAQCCPDPATIIPLGGDDGETLQCPDGLVLVDNRPPTGDRIQLCQRTDGGSVTPKLDIAAPGDYAEAGMADFVWEGRMDGGDRTEYVCFGDTGRVALRIDKSVDPTCYIEWNIETAPTDPPCP